MRARHQRPLQRPLGFRTHQYILALALVLILLVECY